ncbi:MAG: TetR/AcrR family transcriptional regulator [Proteobacteria bacterium]|nr:TetR/AcrR family transcriptional regulator [Pseudomonadota bacterium]
MKKGKTAFPAKSQATQAQDATGNPNTFLRAVPMQARAKQSVEDILHTAARLLDEVGLDGFNTNLLAERAGVRIRTVYRYFPDKYAVLMALAAGMMKQWDEWMDREFQKLADPNQDWETEQRRIIPLLLKNIRQPGGVSVLKAIAAIPQVMESDMLLLDRMSEKMSAALKQRGIKLPPARLHSVCKVSLLSVNSGVEVYFRLEETQRAQFLSELINMQIAYLRLYLD